MRVPKPILAHVVVDDSFGALFGGVHVDAAEHGEEQHEGEERGKAAADAGGAGGRDGGSAVGGQCRVSRLAWLPPSPFRSPVCDGMDAAHVRGKASERFCVI